MKLTGILLILACSLAYFSQAQGDCCNTSLELLFAVDGGACGQAGAETTPQGCKLRICADGRAKTSKYCGRGSCNSDGCDCSEGCISGNWQQSFVDNNKNLKIVVTNANWKTD